MSKAEIESLEKIHQEISLAVLSLNEELPFAEINGDQLAKIKARISRTEALYEESFAEYQKGNIDEAEVKVTVAKNMIKKAQDLVSQI